MLPFEWGGLNLLFWVLAMGHFASWPISLWIVSGEPFPEPFSGYARLRLWQMTLAVGFTVASPLPYQIGETSITVPAAMILYTPIGIVVGGALLGYFYSRILLAMRPEGFEDAVFFSERRRELEQMAANGDEWVRTDNGWQQFSVRREVVDEAEEALGRWTD